MSRLPSYGDVKEKLKSLDCDPLELSAKIARGHNVFIPHPKLDKVREEYLDLLTMIEDGELEPEKFLDFWVMLEEVLTNAPPTAAIQSAHIQSLVRLVAPTLGSIAHVDESIDWEDLESIPEDILISIANGEYEE